MEKQDYLRGTVEKYLKELSERRIVPGGGSASALTAALGAGLNLMVINYSVKNEDESPVLSAARKEQQDSLERLSAFIDEDCAAFRALMEAVRSKSGAQKEFMAAAEIPMKICHECRASMNIVARFQEEASRTLLTDVGCAVNMLKAAFYSAELNVKVNLKHIKDGPFVENAGNTLKTLKEEIDRTSEDILKKLEKTWQM